MGIASASCVLLSCVVISGFGGALAYSTESFSEIDPRYSAVTLYVPDSYDPTTPTPLLVALHGYGSSGSQFEAYVKFLPRVDEYGFLYAHPDSRVNESGPGFWDATDHCCDFDDVSEPDVDVRYLTELIARVKARYSVSERQVFIVGHSNGGMMAHRMACDRPGEVAAIVAINGTGYLDESLCDPTTAVHVAHLHGTSDTRIAYDGGALPENGKTYPGAEETVADWLNLNACAARVETLPAMDLDTSLPGAETERLRYAVGCNLGGSVELWKMNDGVHSPALGEGFRTEVLDYLLAHPGHRLLFRDRDTIEWDPVEVATPPTRSFNMYRGLLSELGDGDGDGLPDHSPAYGDCANPLDPDLTDERFQDASVPSPGDGFFYLLDYVADFRRIEGGIGKARVPGPEGQPIHTQRPVEVPCP